MLSDEEIDRIKQILKKEERIQVAYLYGSYAVDMEHEGSDVDIGVLLSEGADYNYRDAARTSLKIEEEIDKEADVRILNGKDPRFLHNILEDAVIILSRNEGLREDFEAGVLTKYLDLKPFIEQHDRKIEERVRE